MTERLLEILCDTCVKRHDTQSIWLQIRYVVFAHMFPACLPRTNQVDMQYRQNHRENEEQGEYDQEEKPYCFDVISLFDVVFVILPALVVTIEADTKPYHLLPCQGYQHQEESPMV